MSEAINTQNDHWVTLSNADRDAAISLMLEYAECLEDELVVQAIKGDFKTKRARIAWFTVGNLISLRREYG